MYRPRRSGAERPPKQEQQQQQQQQLRGCKRVSQQSDDEYQAERMQRLCEMVFACNFLCEAQRELERTLQQHGFKLKRVEGNVIDAQQDVKGAGKNIKEKCLDQHGVVQVAGSGIFYGAVVGGLATIFTIVGGGVALAAGSSGGAALAWALAGGAGSSTLAYGAAAGGVVGGVAGGQMSAMITSRIKRIYGDMDGPAEPAKPSEPGAAPSSPPPAGGGGCDEARSARLRELLDEKARLEEEEAEKIKHGQPVPPDLRDRIAEASAMVGNIRRAREREDRKRCSASRRARPPISDQPMTEEEAAARRELARARAAIRETLESGGRAVRTLGEHREQAERTCQRLGHLMHCLDVCTDLIDFRERGHGMATVHAVLPRRGRQAPPAPPRRASASGEQPQSGLSEGADGDDEDGAEMDLGRTLSELEEQMERDVQQLRELLCRIGEMLDEEPEVLSTLGVALERATGEIRKQDRRLAAA